MDLLRGQRLQVLAGHRRGDFHPRGEHAERLLLLGARADWPRLELSDGFVQPPLVLALAVVLPNLLGGRGSGSS